MDLQKLNSATSYKELKNVKDLPINQKYKIVQLRFSKTKYGDSIVAETEDFTCFLPRRFYIHFEKEGIENFNDALNSRSIYLVSKGKVEFNLLTRKGVFPYDYIDSWERFTETCLPSKTNFYSQLYDQCITDQDYQHALDVWKTFNIKTLGEYSDLYLKNDVLLLADIFENFRRTCLLTYELDPLHFYTAPGLAFDAMLKTKVLKATVFWGWFQMGYL
ncbi:hypothetical protein NQ315_006144 [Exocentrus adspersus]|uniref:DNA-directed DNA polymerase n=1 Tax=Exocentrus adspersus TaxID=1586481 RepID=A0AAV8VDR7_9CUCU|nr:hypothetical protein NQ315_006144 [Exocentrus adspersus]